MPSQKSEILPAQPFTCWSTQRQLHSPVLLKCSRTIYEMQLYAATQDTGRQHVFYSMLYQKITTTIWQRAYVKSFRCYRMHLYISTSSQVIFYWGGGGGRGQTGWYSLEGAASQWYTFPWSHRLLLYQYELKKKNHEGASLKMLTIWSTTSYILSWLRFKNASVSKSKGSIWNFLWHSMIQ